MEVVVVVVDVVAAVVVLMAERDFLVPQLETPFHEAPKLAICLLISQLAKFWLFVANDLGYFL